MLVAMTSRRYIYWYFRLRTILSLSPSSLLRYVVYVTRPIANLRAIQFGALPIISLVLCSKKNGYMPPFFLCAGCERYLGPLRHVLVNLRRNPTFGHISNIIFL